MGLSLKRRVGEVTFRVFPFSGLEFSGRTGILRGLPRRGRWEVEQGGGSISSTLLTEKMTSSMWGEVDGAVDVGMSGVEGGSDFCFLPRFRLFTPAIDECFELCTDFLKWRADF